MDEWIDGWMDGWMDEINVVTDRCINRQRNSWINGQLNQCTVTSLVCMLT